MDDRKILKIFLEKIQKVSYRKIYEKKETGQIMFLKKKILY